MPDRPAAELLAGLPPDWPEPLLARIRRRGGDRTVLVLDDDPTGTQTVRGVPVLVDPAAADLEALLRAGTRLAFVLTNSRSLPEARAVALARRLGGRIRAASRRTRRPVSLVSRSDSTLRGHFPTEVDALAEAAGIGRTPTLLMPYLGEAGRLTVGDVHYVVRDGRAVPVGETEYARDPAFAYAESNLRDWVAARVGEPARPIERLSLALVREGGPAAVAEVLRRLPEGAVCIANAVDDRDAEVVAAAMVEVERDRPLLARTAAGYVRARAGQPRRPDLRPSELPVGAGAGLIVVGSHVPATTAQLVRLLEAPPIAVELVELAAADALDPGRARRARAAVSARAAALLAAGVTPVVATSRELLPAAPDDGSGLRAAGRVSRLLTGVARDLAAARPAWVLAKGGITSSDVATRSLGARSATVLGQLLAGVPAWRVERAAGGRVLLVVFPGNVGGPDALYDAVARLAEAGARRAAGLRKGAR